MSFEEDLKNSEEYDKMLEVLGNLKKFPDVENAIIELCKYAYSMGEAMGYYDATGDWKY